MDIRDRVIIALDLPDVAQARAIVSELGDDGTFYKVGYELAFAGGLDFARELRASGKKVFLDLKLHDIPNTIEKGVGQIARMGVNYLTVHAYPQTLAAAAKGASGSDLGVLGVSALTSMDDGDLARAGYGIGVQDLVGRRARQIQEAGCLGIICSAADLASVRQVVGDALRIITPGIRPSGSDTGDQKRIMTPGQAIRSGVDQMVIGRPITAVADPQHALHSILGEISAAL
jgi:orotidine-5'-phosphate decarboxylase